MKNGRNRSRIPGSDRSFLRSVLRIMDIVLFYEEKFCIF